MPHRFEELFDGQEFPFQVPDLRTLIDILDRNGRCLDFIKQITQDSKLHTILDKLETAIGRKEAVYLIASIKLFTAQRFKTHLSRFDVVCTKKRKSPRPPTNPPEQRQVQRVEPTTIQVDGPQEESCQQEDQTLLQFSNLHCAEPVLPAKLEIPFRSCETENSSVTKSLFQEKDYTVSSHNSLPSPLCNSEEFTVTSLRLDQVISRRWQMDRLSSVLDPHWKLLEDELKVVDIYTAHRIGIAYLQNTHYSPTEDLLIRWMPTREATVVNFLKILDRINNASAVNIILEYLRGFGRIAANTLGTNLGSREQNLET